MSCCSRPAQADAGASYLAGTYADAISLQLGVRSMLDNVVWGEEARSRDAELAMMLLGHHLGFTSTRPVDITGGSKTSIADHLKRSYPQRENILDYQTIPFCKIKKIFNIP
ncbi:hypothetical protein [Actinacidiphila epipremni]|uniref:Uncharacterized protein n=1 Tax=Actinacidiphila epipremni TaxID=2053013 RepID=A0ABX0ZHL9_9ACTN|nr:hypothetical protein [Actinacidiphila epipremni]NJP42540.1 hypothetical protein [Actinacidiphila epipremni]